MFKKVQKICLIALFFMSSCIARQSLPDLSEGYKSIYQELESRRTADVSKLEIRDTRHEFLDPVYIKVWRGSYRDFNGNMVDEGWEWVLVTPGGPNANF